MKDIGSMPMIESASNKYYPTITLSKNEIKGVDVGDTVYIKAKCKVVSADISMGETIKYRLEVRKVEKLENAKKEE